MRILIVFGLVFFANMAFGQIAFFHLYAEGGDDNAEGAVQLEDSSYVITGSSDSYPFTPNSQAFLMKLDSTGVPIWSKHYGGPEMDQGKRIAYKQGFGFLVAGTTNSIGAGGYDFYLFKTDESGELEWERAYGAEGWERLYGAAMTSDTGMFMVGETLSDPTNGSDMYIVRTDKNGDTLWTKTIGGPGDDGLRGCAVWDDSTFYVAGQTYIEDSMFTKAYIAKYHEDGTLIWSDTIGPHGNYFINDVEASDYDVFCVGYRNGPTVNGNDMYFMRHFHNGVFDGETAHPSIGDFKAHQASAYGIPDKRYVGRTFFDEWSLPDGDDLYIVKTNLVFYQEPITALHLYYPQPDKVNEIIPTNDGGILAVGQTNGEAMGVHHAWVLKVGPNDLTVDYTPPHVVYNLVVDVDEITVDDKLSVFPNPTTGIINIESSVNDFVQVEILNNLGQTLKVDSFQGKYSIDLSTYGVGMYLLKTTVGGVSNVRKIVAQ